MALSAGAVYATLGGKFDRAGFDQFGSSMYRAQAQMEAGEKRMTASAARTSESLHKIGTAAKVAATGGVVALGAAIAGSVKVAADFDKAMRNVNSIARLNETQFKALSKSVLDLSGKTAQSPKTLAEGMYQLVSSGFKAKDSLVILKASAIAATAGLTDTATATTAVAAVLNAYHLTAKDAGRVSDQLFQTVNRGVITFDVLAHNIGTVLPFASSLGVGLDQVGASISTLTKEGLSGELAITNLKNVMSAFLKPSKGLATAIKETGATSGEALVKAKGFQGALEAVAKTTDGTKGAMAKLFPNIRALTAALDLTGKSAKTAESDVAGFKNTQGATSQVFAEQAKSAAFQWQKFKAQLQATGIVIGSAVLPVLTRAVTALGGWVTGFAKSGDAAKFGHAVAAGFKEAGQVLGDVFGIAKSVVGVFADIAKALNLGDASHLEAILAAIAGFKIAGIVAPLVATFAAALTTLVEAAITAPTVGAFLGDIVAAGGGLGALVPIVAALGAALLVLSAHHDSTAEAAKKMAQAERDAADAIHQAQDAALATADATFGARQADLDLLKAREHLNEVTGKYPKSSHEYRSALEAERQANLRSVEAHHQLTTAKQTDNRATADAITKAKAQESAAKNQINAVLRGTFSAKGSAEVQDKLTSALGDYVRAQGAVTSATNVRALRELQLQRLLNGGDLIANKNAASIAHLASVYGHLPKNVQTKIDAEPQAALAKIGSLVSQLHGVDRARTVAKILTTADSARAQVAAFQAIVEGLPPSKAFRILQNAGSATAQINQLRAAIDSLPANRTVTIHIGQSGGVPKHLPGAAAGGRTTGPQMYLVGEGSDPVEWIIPRDRKYRGRALGLLQDAMASLLPGAKAGAKHGGTIKESTYLKLSPDQFKAERDKLDQRLSKLKQGETQKDKKGHLTATAVKDKAAIPGLEQQIKRATEVFHKANDYSNRIQARLDDAQIAQTNMGRFDAISQQVGKGGKPTQAAKAAEKQYTAAVKERLKYLTEARAALQVAVGFAKPGSKWGRDVRQNLATVLADITDLHGAQSTGAKDAAAAAAQPTTAYTQAEQDRLDKINADIALAALTDTPTDDVTAAKSLVGFLGGVLTEAQASPAAHGGNAGISEIAGALKTARDNLASLTASPTASQDLQAQLDQARAATAAAQLGQRNSDALLQVLAGPGDIGTGGPNARATVQQNIYTLHPGDPKTLRAIGDAAVAGIGYQPLRQSPRETLGI